MLSSRNATLRILILPIDIRGTEMTYKEIQAAYRRRYGRTVKTCWIADVKRKHGKTTRVAPNRAGAIPQEPCPPDIFPKLEALMKELGVI